MTTTTLKVDWAKHRECCGWRPPEERCGEKTLNAKNECMRVKGHDGRHYDIEQCVQFGDDRRSSAIWTDRPSTTRSAGEGIE